mmetsp:Transcript_25998/g.40901  ORF Transcript_25998/g.40901 Transcript_25998/m.40901 type:complete len:187 (-) Transcript_25998:233-793(-)
MYTLVLIWSVRLTHSYFRRERWQCGWREDWRFADKRQALGPVAWTPVSFFYAYVAQQPMLVGLCLPLVAAAFAPVAAAPPGATEAVLSMLCILGISFACIADNQLYRFMEENKRRLETGQPKVLLLETGLWKFSRHPNYFGEQLWQETMMHTPPAANNSLLPSTPHSFFDYTPRPKTLVPPMTPPV